MTGEHGVRERPKGAGSTQPWEAKAEEGSDGHLSLPNASAQQRQSQSLPGATWSKDKRQRTSCTKGNSGQIVAK